MGKPTQINIFPDGYGSEGKHRWHYCYLHGEAEFQYDEDNSPAPDVFMADEPMPEQAGNYLVWIDNKPAVAVIAMQNNILSGRVSLISDTKALQHALTVKDWM